MTHPPKTEQDFVSVPREPDEAMLRNDVVRAEAANTPAKPPADDARALVEAAVNQNGAMRQELAHVGNLVSDLARAMKVEQANDDGTWPDLAGRIRKLTNAALARAERQDGRA